MFRFVEFRSDALGIFKGGLCSTALLVPRIHPLDCLSLS